MLVQDEQTGGQEESKEATSDLTVVPTTIMAMMTMTTMTVRRARFWRMTVMMGLIRGQKKMNANRLGNMQFDTISN